MATYRAYAAEQAGGELKPFEFDPGPLGPDEVEIRVETCGVCHSDLSMLNNEWGMTQYPFVPGHEVVGQIAAMGQHVPRLEVGQRVGLGWFSRSCLHCLPCLSGDHNLCAGQSEQTIVGRHGGFADRVRCHWLWALPVPEGVPADTAGPLFCGGLTVFNPIVQLSVRPTDRVGVIGIGGLGHIALQFLNKWGCEVYAFTSSENKQQEARKMGAHHAVNSRNADDLAKVAGKLDLILSTVNVSLDWDLYLAALSPKGKFHTVGAISEPMQIAAFPLIVGQKSISGTPLGSPANSTRMLDFCARHQIAPVVEKFPMAKVNDALAHLAAGKARYRIVLERDWGD